VHVRVLPARVRLERSPRLVGCIREAPGAPIAQALHGERRGCARLREHRRIAGRGAVVREREDDEGVAVAVLAPVEGLAGRGCRVEVAAVHAIAEALEKRDAVGRELERARAGAEPGRLAERVDLARLHQQALVVLGQRTPVAVEAVVEAAEAPVDAALRPVGNELPEQVALERGRADFHRPLAGAAAAAPGGSG
jgi:hypothetical protein